MKKLFPLLFSMILVCSVVFSACVGNNDSDSPRNSINKEQITIYYNDPASFDPALCTDLVTASYLIQVFSGLVVCDSNGEVVGDIASSWDISNDGKTYTFYLKNNVYFHNGDHLTAADIKYSWTRALHPSIGSTMAKSYLGNIVGADEVLAGANNLSGVRVINDYVLEVEINAPSSYFLACLAYPVAFAVNQRILENNGDFGHPVGTGPYEFVSWMHSTEVVFKAFNDFYGQKAKIKEVRFITKPSRGVEMFAQGTVDITYFTLTYIDQVLDGYGAFKEHLRIFEDLTTHYLAFVVDKAPFDDPLIRQAFSMAIDREKIVETAYRGSGIYGNSFVPSGIAGYNPAQSPYTFDVEAAKRLIAQSSYGSVENLPTIYLTMTGGGNILAQEVLAIVDQWKTNLGVNVEIIQQSAAELAQGNSAVEGNVVISGWVADYASPQNFLEILLASYGAVNLGGYNSEEFDRLIAAANAATNINQSYALYAQAEALALKDAAVITLAHGVTHVLVNNIIEGYEQISGGIPRLNTIYLREN